MCQREIEGSRRYPDAPYSGIGKALSSILERGAEPQDITDIVRGMQAALLFSICSLLDDPGDLPDEVKNVSWCLFEISEGGNVLTPIQAVHESVLEMDPSGREMRPRPS